MSKYSIDYKQFAGYWREQQKTAVHMDRESVLSHVNEFIKNNLVCAMATGFGSDVRNTPLEYIYMDGRFYSYTEGGDKFLYLESNKKVSLAISKYSGDRNDSHGLTVQGICNIYPPRCELFRKVLEYQGIPYDVVKSFQTDVALLEIVPLSFEMYDTDFVKQGYDVRQRVDF